MSSLISFRPLGQGRPVKSRDRRDLLPGWPRRAVPAALAAMLLPAAAAAQSVVASARIEAVRAVVARHAPEQGRMLRCLSVTNDKWHRTGLEDWEEQLGKAAEIIAKAGIAASDSQALLAPVSVQALVSHTGSPAELLISCKADTGWERRWELFTSYTFSGDLREVLEGKR